MTAMRFLASRGVLLAAPAALAIALGCAAQGGDTDTDTEDKPTCTLEKVYDEPACSLQGFSANEIYVLAEDAIIRWDGESWKKHVDKEPGIVLGPLFVDNQRNLYSTCYYLTTGTCKVRKYGVDGWSCLWNDYESFLVGHTWGTGFEDNLYAVDHSYPPRIFHHDPGGDWTEVWSGKGYITRIRGRGADDIYAIGSGFGESHAIHFDGTGWKELPPITGGPVDLLLDLSFDPSGNLWVVGRDGSDYTDNTFPFLGKWDGSSWEVVIDYSHVSWDHEEHFTGYQTGIHFFDDGKAVAVGPKYGSLYYDGSRWWDIKGVYGRQVWGVSALDFHVAASSGLYRGSCQ